MNFLFWSSAITMIWLCVVAGVVIYAKPQEKINQAYTLLLISLASWMFVDVFAYFPSLCAYVRPITWFRCANTPAMYVPVLMFYFYCEISHTLRFRKLYPYLLALSTVLVAALWVSPLLVRSVWVPSLGLMVAETGLLYDLFFAYLLVAWVSSHAVLIARLKQLKGVRKEQAKYILLAGGLTLGSIFVYFPTVAWGLAVPRIDNLLQLVYISIISYALLRHRLLDVSIVIVRSFVYLFTVTCISVLFALSVFGIGYLSTTRYQVPVFFEFFIPSVLITLLYIPLREALDAFSYKLFFRKKYNLAQAIHAINRSITQIVNLDFLVETVVGQLQQTLALKTMDVYVYQSAIPCFRCWEYHSDQSVRTGVMLDQQAEVSRWFREHPQHLLVPSDEFTEIDGLMDMRNFMERHRYELVVPLFSKKMLIGFIALGNKLSGQAFSMEDIYQLEALSDNLAIAIENTQLYEDVFRLKSYFESVLDGLPVGVATFNEKGEVAYVNKQGVHFLGISQRNQIQNQHWSHVDALNPFKPLLEEAFSHGKTHGFKEVRMNEVHYGVSVSRTLTQGKTSNESGFMLVLADLSTIYQLQSMLLRKERLAALGVMAAGLAHEIRNPMVSIKAFSQLLPTKYDDPTYRRKFEQVVLPQLNRIEDLITALLHAGKAPKPSRMLVDANEIIKDVLLLSELDLKNMGCKFHIDSIGPVTIYADRSQMTQVFLNLTRNAVQAMAQGGSLAVAVRELSADWSEIEFKDSGVGMSDGEMEHLFDPFFTTKADGTGLGLSISYRIIEEHGGKIVLDSTPRLGTSFIIRLPRKPVVATQIQDRMYIHKSSAVLSGVNKPSFASELPGQLPGLKVRLLD